MTTPAAVIERLEQRLEQLRAQVALHETAALQEQAEIRGMEAVIEAVMPLLQSQQPSVAGAQRPHRRRNLRALVWELQRAEPGLSTKEMADRIGHCKVSQVASAVLAKAQMFQAPDEVKDSLQGEAAE